MIIDVAMTGVDGCSRKIDDDPLQPLNARFLQKNSKYRGVAEQNGFEFMPFVFSHNGQIHPETVSFICRQIEAKLMLVDGRVSKSKKESRYGSYGFIISLSLLTKLPVETSYVKLQK